jgi:chitinase
MRDLLRSLSAAAPAIVRWSALPTARVDLRAFGRWGAAVVLLGAALVVDLSSGCGVSWPIYEQRVPFAANHVVGYVAGWEPRHDIAAEKLMAVNYAFAHIAHGRVVLDQPKADEVIAGLRALKKRNARLSVLISIGGWGADGFSDAALTAESRDKFAQSVADLLIQTQADGVDIDWEYPGLPGPGIVHRDEDKRNFSELLRAIRQRLYLLAQEKLHPPYLLTAALADGEFVAYVELDQVHLFLDWINLMTYDFHNSLTKTTGHHAALARSASSAASERSVESAVAQFVAAGVGPGQLVVGVPFYGRAFADVKDENNGLDQPYGHYAGDYPWPKLKADYIDRNGFVRHWDDTAKVPYLWNATTREFISYDDPQSLSLKARYVRQRGLLGMMYWEQSQDPQGELLDVLATALRSAPH